MSQLECPSCKLKVQALGAPANCPRCLVRKGERIELISSPVSGSAPSKPSGSIDPRTDSQLR
jgi:hypothetical protein